jgi:AraC-like DNA-binding protein
MIEEHRVFHFREYEIIEKLTIRAPFRYIRPFQESACFLYMREGEAVLYASDKTLRFTNHEGVLLRCGTYFGDLIGKVNAESCVVYAIHLFPELLREIYANEIPPFIREKSAAALSVIRVPSSEIVDRFIESLDFYFENPAIVSDYLLQLKMKELLLLLLQTENAANVKDLVSGLYSVRTVTIREIVETHIFSNLTVEELAELCYMSLSSFKREFQAIYKEPPATYLRGKRMEKARELLLISGHNVSEVAFQVGYPDIAQFSRTYRNHFGYTPSQTSEHRSE